MSASIDTSAIFMRDTPKQILNKVNKYAFSGGQITVEEHREKGGDTTKDVPYQYLTFFLEDDGEVSDVHPWTKWLLSFLLTLWHQNLARED